ncbi:MAG: glycosyltransferase, partial [Bacillota bacterium]|nr:glycosyltransferase [Bacillota bacterium]
MKDKINLSICTVVHNEEARIPDYLSRIAGRAEEIIMADLGSTDRTVALSRNAGIMVYPVQWKQNRSEIKNFCMEQASGRWILFLQADERLSDEDWNQLYSMLDNPNAEEYLIYVEPAAKYGGIASPVNSLRLIRNRKEYRYQGRSYEYIPDEIIGNRRDSELRIQQVREDQSGCMEFDTNLFDAERALLLSKDLEEEPQSAYLLYQTGIALMNQGQSEDAAHYLEAARETVIIDYFYAPHLYKCLAWSYLAVE